MAKVRWKVLKIVFAIIRKSLNSNCKQVEGVIEGIKQGKLERNAGKVFNVGFGQQYFEFSCKNSPNPIVRFELAKNKRGYFPSCIRLPTVIEDYVENECYTGKNGEMHFTDIRTPLIIFNCRNSPLSPSFLSSYPKNFLKYSPTNEVDHRAEEFITWFHRTQFLKL